MTLFRRLFALILTLAVILSGAESAVARAEMEAASYPVLCAEGAGAAQAFDPTGRPLPHHAACPHCLGAGSLSAALAVPPATWHHAPGRLILIRWPAPTDASAAPPLQLPQARGPPTAI